eukprot:SAG31_NODE_34216_length_335_cov_0.881356_1_plen_37_part_10
MAVARTTAARLAGSLADVLDSCWDYFFSPIMRGKWIE